jgi:hypothetical protein
MTYNSEKIQLEFSKADAESLGIMVHFWLTNLKDELKIAVSDNDNNLVNELLEDITHTNKIYDIIHKDIEPIMPHYLETHA